MDRRRQPGRTGRSSRWSSRFHLVPVRVGRSRQPAHRSLPDRRAQSRGMSMKPTDVVMLGVGLLAVRLAFGLYMAAHGAQKVFGWFGGHGLTATSAGFETIGFRPGRLFASAAGWAELVSG